jgi:antitoxin VapB
MYILYMALHINNPEVERKVREMASVTGESITEAIGRAAEERIARSKPARGTQRTPSVDEILELVRSFDLQPINSDLTEDEILGYGPDGYCV